MNAESKQNFSFAHKLLGIIFAGIIFSAILAAFTALAVLAARLSGYNNIFIIALGAIPASVFYSGLTAVVKNRVAERKKRPLLPTFFGAVKENAGTFALLGIAAYLLCVCTLFAVLYYTVLAIDNFVFGIALIAYSFFALALTAALLYSPLVAQAYRLKFGAALKTSFSLAFGKLSRSIPAALCTFALCSAGAAAIKLSRGGLRIAAAAAAILILPALITAINTAIISPHVQKMLGSFEPKPEPAAVKPEELHTQNTDSDYIFVNGKMIKNPNRPKQNSGDN